MQTKLLRIEVSDANVTVFGSALGSTTMQPLGVFPGGINDLPALIAQIGEPHETQQLEGRYVMTWRLAPNHRSFSIGQKRVARGSQSFSLDDDKK